MSLNKQRAEELFANFGQQQVLVIGDLMLDRYIQGTVERISPEAPVPVVHVQSDSNVPGGACNVASNIRALGGEASIAGIAGTDSYGDELIRLMAIQRINTDAVLRPDDFQTIVKTRVVAERQQICRVDRESVDHSDVHQAELIELITTQAKSCSSMIIEDYGKGVIQQPVVDHILKLAKAEKLPVGIDPKDNHALEISGITLATPNRKEAWHGAKANANADVEEVGATLMATWQPEHLLITLGPEGMMLFEENTAPHLVPTRAREVFDVSGAGDTVIAVCLLAFAAGANFVEAAELANHAAGVVVAKLGTATCTPQEILETMS